MIARHGSAAVLGHCPARGIDPQDARQRVADHANPMVLSGDPQSRLVQMLQVGLGSASRIAFVGPRNFLAVRPIIALRDLHLEGVSENSTASDLADSLHPKYANIGQISDNN